MKRYGTSGAGVAKLAAGLPLLLLALAAWIVTIAGVSIIRHELGSNSVSLVDANGTPIVTRSLSFTWFVVAATFFALLFALIHAVGTSVSFLASTHSAVVGLLAITTTLSILETRDWNDARRSYPVHDKLWKGIVTTFSGFLVVSVLSALLIIILGNSAAAQRHNTDAYHTSNVHSNPVVTTTTTPHQGAHTAV